MDRREGTRQADGERRRAGPPNTSVLAPVTTTPATSTLSSAAVVAAAAEGVAAGGVPPGRELRSKKTGDGKMCDFCIIQLVIISQCPLFRLPELMVISYIDCLM